MFITVSCNVVITDLTNKYYDKHTFDTPLWLCNTVRNIEITAARNQEQIEIVFHFNDMLMSRSDTL